jgi:iron complex transport system substrate-binding protein
VRIPLQNVAVYTSVHASIIEQLNATDKIIGVCEPRYIDIPVLQERLKDGTLADFGEATSPNVEKMIEQNVEAVIASPFQNGSYGAVEKLGIPIIEGADYMEETPLGRAEWIRFYGMLFSKYQTADSIFAETEQRYNALKALIPDSIYRPTVFSDKKYGASWFVSRGGSLIATAYKDAGADYVFSELDGSGSTPLSFEAVFDKCIHADFWLIKYNQPEEMTYESLSSEYTPYSNFDAFKNKNIYVCNTGEVPYYEEYPLHPDWLLEDLIRVFHPEILPGAPVRYFQKMEK